MLDLIYFGQSSHIYLRKCQILILNMITKKLTNILRTITKLANNPIYKFSTMQDQPSQTCPKPNKIPIKTLPQLILQQKNKEIVDLDSMNITSSNIHLTVVRAIKLNLYRDPVKSEKIIRLVNQYKDDLEQIKKFIYIILPIDNLFPQINQFYKDIALKFLTQQLYNILENLDRMISKLAELWKDQDWMIRDYSKEQSIARLLVPAILAKSEEFEISVFYKTADTCITLGVEDSELGAFLLGSLTSDTCRMKMKDIFLILRYLSKVNVFPTEYFYKNKSKWIQTIESYNKFSTKKSYQSIKLLQVITGQNPMFCEKLIKRIQDVLLEAMPSIDHEQLANLWHICNRAKFGIYRELVQKMLEKMSALVSGMQNRELCMLVRGFDRFKGLKDHQDICRRILTVIDKKLVNSRQYQKEIVKQILKKLDNKEIIAIV